MCAIKFFIIIPIYNVESYLHQCLDSILEQTYTNFEAILINDGSSDNSEKIAQEYVSKDQRFTLISQENQGLSRARNSGLEIIKSKWEAIKEREREHSYICFLDSDDWWERNMLQSSVKILQNMKAKGVALDMILYGRLLIDKKEAVAYRLVGEDLENQLFSSQDFIKKLYNTNYIPVRAWGNVYSCNFLFQTNIRFIPKILFEDVPFVLECLLKAKLLYTSSALLIHYRLSPNSVTRDKSPQNLRKHANSYFFITKYLCSLKDSYQGEYKEFLERLAKWSLMEALGLLKKLGYNNLDFTRGDLKPYRFLLERRRWLCIYFPRLYTLPKRLKYFVKSLFQKSYSKG
ncbi:glycosyltransferase [Helicobacter mesocricetorum]|uniref:glycosyltransferase n=1 Tax=Helicobacter mesocricetorum TaxID=87012 RepID=UPI000CF1C3DE|nr:glycosyltransferase [Helicobacter mesocricetorum]